MLIDFHCHTKFAKKVGWEEGVGVLPPKIFTFLKLQDCISGLFLKQIRKRIGSILTVFYKNCYHFTKLTTLLCKFYLIFTISFTVWGGLHPIPHIPRLLRPWRYSLTSLPPCALKITHRRE